MRRVVAMLVAAVVTAAGCGGQPEPAGQPAGGPPTGPTTEPSAEPPTEPGPTADGAASADPAGGSPAPTSPTATPAAACEPVEHPPLQDGSHLIGDTEPPVPYSSVPPTSGWHASGAFEITVHGAEDPLSEPRQVSVLEAGGVVVTYRDLPAEDIAALAALATEEFPGRVSVTPYHRLEPGQVAVTGWNALQRCAGVDLDAVRAFVAEHAEAEPHIPGSHGH